MRSVRSVPFVPFDQGDRAIDAAGFHPMPVRVAAQPGRLALRIVARVLLDQGDGGGAIDGAIEVGEELLVANGVQGVAIAMG